MRNGELNFEELKQEKTSNISQNNLFKATDPEKSIWVSANAGTGKTYILIRRILRLLIAGNKPERILCITFTNAAANEMQNRIIEEAGKLILYNDDVLLSKLKELGEFRLNLNKTEQIRKNLEYIIDSPERLKIQTIHGFCQAILKKFPLEAGVAPFFDILDEFKQKLLLQECWRGFSTKVSTETYISLVESSAVDEVKKRIFELVSKNSEIDNVITDSGGYEGYFKKLKTKLNINETDKNKLAEDFFASEIGFIKTASEELNRAISRKLKAHKLLENIIEFRDINRLKQFLKSDKNGRVFDNKTIEKETEIHQQLSTLYSKISKLVERIKDIEVFECTKNYLTSFKIISEIYREKKLKQHLLDYDDLIEKAYTLLNNSDFKDWVLYKLDGGIDHLLVDEAQDTSEKQWKIINQVSNEFFSGENVKELNRTLFIVGDEKQSIYGFQGADIGNYLKSKIALKENLEKVNLEISYRSLPAILNFTDKVFEDAVLKQKITDEDHISHSSSRESEGFGKVELIKQVEYEKAKTERVSGVKSWVLPQEYKEDDEVKNKVKLASQIAEKIKNTLDSKAILPSIKTSGRAVQAKDIMILIKRRGSDILSGEIEKKLKEFGIGTSNKEKLDISETLAAKDVLSIIKFCLNPNDDLNLAGLLKSCFYNFSEEKLYNLAKNRKTNLLNCLSNKEPEIYSNLLSLKNVFSKSNSIYSFLVNILNNLDLNKKLAGYFGENIDSKINQFLNKVLEFEQEENFSNEKLITHFENNEIFESSNIEDAENSVKILTVHGSKGLQSPIVIMANAADFSEKRKDYILNDNDILICDSTSKKSEKYLAEEKLEKAKEYDEYFRLLYVALTRAKDELYIFSAASNSSKKNEQSWQKCLKNAIKNLAEENGNGNYIYSDESYQNLERAGETIKNNNVINVDDFYKQKINLINKEAISPSKLLTGSKPLEVNKNIDFSFGNAVHKLLEYLPNFEKAKHKEITEYLLKEFNLTSENKNIIVKEVDNLLKDEEFKNLYSHKNKAEIPIAGFAGDKFVSGYIDLLIFKDSEIIIADYKTNRDVSENKEKLVEKYRGQLELYKEILQKIYPEKTIKICLIFTMSKEIVYLQ